MNEPTIRRLLALVEKTGDKVIVTDPAGEHPYVLMSLDQYERLIGPPASAYAEASAFAKAAADRSADKPAALPPPAEKPAPRKQAPERPAAPPSQPKQPADLWRAKLGLDAVEPPVRELIQGAAARPRIAAPAEEAPFETEGEEQFFLEPLE